VAIEIHHKNQERKKMIMEIKPYPNNDEYERSNMELPDVGRGGIAPRFRLVIMDATPKKRKLIGDKLSYKTP
jgi:hypothetical protein